MAPAALHTPEAIARAREMYLAGVPVLTITAETGLPHGTLYYWLDGGPADCPDRLPPIPRRREAVLGQRRVSVRSTKAGLVARLWRTAERQVADIETRLVAAGGNADTLEKDAKTLSILARTVRDLVALDAAHEGAERSQTDEEAPRDIEDFRARIAAKMAEFAAGPEGA